MYITFISKDLQKDEELYPSPTCTKLINYLNNNFLKNEFNIIEVPLKGESIKYFNEHPGYQDIMNNYFYTDRLLSLLHNKDIYNFNTNQSNIIEEKYLKTQDIFKDNKQEVFIKEITDISIYDLYRFILNPSEAQIRKLTEIFDDQDTDLTIKEDEPFYTQYPNNYNIILDCINKYVENIKNKDQFDLDSYYEELYKYNQISGNTPEQIYQKIDKEKIYNTINDRLYNEKNGISSFFTNYTEFDFRTN